MPTLAETRARARIVDRWPEFLACRHDLLVVPWQEGRDPKERACERLFENLASGPLGYRYRQLSAQQYRADFLLVHRGLKLAVAEVKRPGAFTSPDAMADAFRQAAGYAHAHRCRFLIVFDGTTLAFARWVPDADNIDVHMVLDLSADAPPTELYFLTHGGLYVAPDQSTWDIPWTAPDVDERTAAGLPHTSYAYVGTITDTKTWKLKYRTADGAPDRKRIGAAVNALLHPNGYSGRQVDLPAAATLLAAIRLARAYRELGDWQPPRRLFDRRNTARDLLWTYLHQQGVEEI